jgi:hypothetical protein
MRDTKSSIVINLQNRHFGDLRASHQRVCVKILIAQIVPMAMRQIDSSQGVPEHDEPAA